MNFIDGVQNLQKNIPSLTQTVSNPFLMVGQMMNKNAPRYPAHFTERIATSVHKCHSSDLKSWKFKFMGTLQQSSKWSAK